MKIKEKVIHESIFRITEELNNLERMMTANPASELIELYRTGSTLFEEVQGEGRFTPEFQEKVARLADEEERLKKEMEAQIGRDLNKMLERQVELQFELRDLQGELFFMKERERRNS